ncbi:MAG: HlyD family type I secretion periplasmic adaptor subunit [Paracoccus sp. (in: a-proteobacteria)]|nr:HlyD family type I secretion periplasmic adaptor subunit [Paracoccus sp. (in: a-proteobacteria)]
MTSPGNPWPLRGTIVIGLMAVAVLLVGVVAWGVNMRIQGAVIAHATLEPAHPNQLVQHPDGGVIERVLVSEGDLVAAGDVLLELDGAYLSAEQAMVEAQYFELLARQGRLTAERGNLAAPDFSPELLAQVRSRPEFATVLDGQSALFDLRLQSFEQAKAQLDRQAMQILAENEGLTRQIAATTRQASLVADELRDQSSLRDRGLTQAARVTALQREAAHLSGENAAFQARKTALDARLAQIKLERLQLLTQRRQEAETELRDIGLRLIELAARRSALAERAARLRVRAPAAGIVHDMIPLGPQSVIRPAQALLSIIRQDQPWRVVARLSPNDINLLHIGQPVALRFPGWGRDLPATVTGRVVRISPAALIEEGARTSYFRAEISVFQDDLLEAGLVQLRPGLPVEAHIATSARSPAAWLMAPLSRYFHRAFREG